MFQRRDRFACNRRAGIKLNNRTFLDKEVCQRLRQLHSQTLMVDVRVEIPFKNVLLRVILNSVERVLSTCTSTDIKIAKTLVTQCSMISSAIPSTQGEFLHVFYTK